MPDKGIIVPDVRIGGGTVALSDPSLRRVSVYADAVRLDLALPAQVPVAALMPSMVDLVTAPGAGGSVVGGPCQLSRLDGGVLDTSMTLAQHAIRDGAALVFSRTRPVAPSPRVDDEAEAVSATVCAMTPAAAPRAARLYRAAVCSWLVGVGAVMLMCCRFGAAGARHSGPVAGVTAGAGCVTLAAAVVAYRLDRDSVGGCALALWATGFAAIAGFVAVPRGPAAPNVLLATMLAAAVSVLAMRLTGRHGALPAAVSGVLVLAAIAALATVVAGAELQVVGSVAAAVSVGLLQASARASVASAGLSPRPERDSAPAAAHLRARAVRAHSTLTALVAALSTAATVGAVATIVGAHATETPRGGGVVFAAEIGAVLLLRARLHHDRAQVLTLICSGTAAVSASCVAGAVAVSQHPLWVCAAAGVLIAAALCGLRAPMPTLSPTVCRAVEWAEYLALAAVVPLSCWICGLFGAARLLNLAS
jgi:type VII secretion integral membrane protein EccD